jgi:hypothetical protein
MRMRTLVVSALLATIGGLTIAPPVAGAAVDAGAVPSTEPRLLDRAPTGEEIDAGRVACRLQITGQDADGRFRTDPMTCWLIEKGDLTPPWQRSKGVAVSSFTIVGYHFADPNFGGSYISVAGTVCNGGWLNLDGNWINRISSTSSPCWVVHYDGYDLTGGTEYRQFGNLSWLDNQANSLQYY